MAMLEEFEERLKKLEDNKKDWWDKLHTIGTLLVPVAIAAAGYWGSAAISKSQVASAITTAEKNRQVEESRLIKDVLAPLVGADEAQKQIALLAIARTDPRTVESIIDIVEELTNTSESTRQKITALVSRLNGSKCDSNSACLSNYCYPGPDEKKYCLREDLNCAFPGDSGARYGDVREFEGKSFQCYNPGGGQLANWK